MAKHDLNDEVDPRIRAYVRTRTEVHAPAGLLNAAMADIRTGSIRRARWSPPLAWASPVLGVLLVVALIAVAVVSAELPAGRGQASPSPSVTPSASADTSRIAVFPDTVLGLPVLTVDRASRLLLDGKLDGRAVAVAGYWMRPGGSNPGCPRPAVQPAWLEGYCVYVAFADRDLHLEGRVEEADGSVGWTWNQPEQGIGLLKPLLLPDSAGGEPIWDEPVDYSRPRPAIPVVLIGHAGDPRLWACAPDRRADCQRAFVVDRVAWVDGEETTFKPTTPVNKPRMTVEQVLEVSDLRVGQVFLTAYAVAGVDVGALDPRLTHAAAPTSWLVRYTTGSLAGDGSSGVDVALIDDETGTKLVSLGLEQADEYAPARLVVDTRDLRAQSGGAAGYPVIEVSGPRGVESMSISVPFVLDPGEYEVRAYIDGDTTGQFEQATCETTVDLKPRADVHLVADFPGMLACTWSAEEPPV